MKISSCSVLLVLALFAMGPAAIGALPPTAPLGRPAIGLAPEGGGALGLAHIGVLAWFEEHHIPIDRIAGTSVGALIGALYATGHSPAEIEKLSRESNFTKIFSLETSYTDLSYRRRQDRRELPQGVQIGLKDGVSIRNALLTDRGLDRFLHDNFAGYTTQNLDYNRLPIPFRCVATDLNDLEKVTFSSGPLNAAVRASVSIAGVFPPVAYRGHYLVDGSIMDNLPTDIARQDLGSAIVIAVHLSAPALTESDVNSIIGVFARAFSAGTAQTERLGEQAATLVLNVKTEKFSTTDYAKAHELIQAGYEAAEEHRVDLMKYALHDADWAAYVEDRNSRRHPLPGTFETLRVEGGASDAQNKVKRDLAPLEGQPIDQAKILTALNQVESNGSYEAGFETFAPQQNPSSASFEAPGPDTGVLVRLSRVLNGPPFLIYGVDISAMNSNVTRTTNDFRLLDQNLGGFGSELRADLRLGFLTQASVEYYRLLDSKGYFLQPHLGILREPVYLWSNQVRISERLEQMAGGGMDAGRTFNRNSQLSLEWRDQVVRWERQLGDDGEPSYSGRSQTAIAHFVYDDTESGTISPRGIHLDLSGGAIYHSLDSQNAPVLSLSVAKTTTVASKNIFGFTADLNSYLKRDVADPLRFTLGGPLRLSASSIDEYRGTDMYLARGGYLRQIAPLPFGLGQGIYLTMGYEAGETWAPERRAFLRQDFAGGVVAATPLGIITFAGSVGDAGRRKVFFTLGRLF